MHKPRQLRIAGYPNVGLTLRALKIARQAREDKYIDEDQEY